MFTIFSSPLFMDWETSRARAAVKIRGRNRYYFELLIRWKTVWRQAPNGREEQTKPKATWPPWDAFCWVAGGGKKGKGKSKTRQAGKKVSRPHKSLTNIGLIQFHKERSARGGGGDGETDILHPVLQISNTSNHSYVIFTHREIYIYIGLHRWTLFFYILKVMDEC